MSDAEITEAECNGCKKEREKEGQPPRFLSRLPVEITQDRLFNRKAIPLLLCRNCDGDAIERALAEHHRRVNS